MGYKVQVHEKSDSRGTWAFHSVNGWYLATSTEHYRTHIYHIKSTHSERLSNTVHSKHKHITNPSLSHADKIMKAISGLANVLKRKPMVTAQQEQEICNLTRLIEATSIHGTLPRVTIRNKDATTSRVPEMEQYTLGRKDLQRSIPQGDSSQ